MNENRIKLFGFGDKCISKLVEFKPDLVILDESIRGDFVKNKQLPESVTSDN